MFLKSEKWNFCPCMPMRFQCLLAIVLFLEPKGGVILPSEPQCSSLFLFSVFLLLSAFFCFLYVGCKQLFWFFQRWLSCLQKNQMCCLCGWLFSLWVTVLSYTQAGIFTT